MKPPSVILVSPKGEGNVGGVARLMGNYGLRDLRIVEPRCNLQSVECKQMSMRGFSIIQEAKIFKTLAEAQHDRTFSIALSARNVEDRRPHRNLYSLVHSFRDHIHAGDSWAFVFGREEAGLRLEELSLCNLQVDIPTVPEMSSINLTSAVAIVLSHWFGLSRNALVDKKEIPVLRPSKEMSQKFFVELQEFLDLVKFTNPENPEMLRDDLRGLFHRADLSDRELRILFGILTQVLKSMAGKP